MIAVILGQASRWAVLLDRKGEQNHRPCGLKTKSRFLGWDVRQRRKGAWDSSRTTNRKKQSNWHWFVYSRKHSPGFVKQLLLTFDVKIMVRFPPQSGLYAMGPLVGDNFVRFLQGGALAITSNILKTQKQTKFADATREAI